MDISLVIQKLLLGGILGLVGQGIRLLAGLKKAFREQCSTEWLPIRFTPTAG